MSTSDTPVVLAAGDTAFPLVSPPLQHRFTRQKSLLTPRDYKAVFDGNTLKISHPSLLLLAISASETASARLGLVIAKKHVRLAVQRNRIKRQLRDSFRHHQHALAGLDIVALARPGLWQLENTQLRTLIEAQWQRLLKQRQKAVQKNTGAAR